MRGGGGANGAVLAKVVPAPLGAVPGNVVGPYGCGSSAIGSPFGPYATVPGGGG